MMTTVGLEHSLDLAAALFVVGGVSRVLARMWRDPGKAMGLLDVKLGRGL